VIDIENHQELRAYLVARELAAAGESIDCSNMHGGVSNRTVLVQFPENRRWVIKQALEKLRVKEDWFSDPERIHHEAEGLRALQMLTPQGAVPGFIFEDHEQHILIMEAVPEPHENYKTLLLSTAPQKSHVIEFATLLSDIHINSAKTTQLSSLFDNACFFENLRLDPYYAFSAGQLPAAAPFLRNLIRQTKNRKLTLVHGDYSPKNILIHHERLVLLDHEVIHIGDPAFDIGFAMAHFLSKANYHRQYRQEFGDAACLFWTTYYNNVRGAPWEEYLEHYCIAHSLACLLARVVGKSPLEYLNEEQRILQRNIVTNLIIDIPRSMISLIQQFSESLNQNE
jgi:5-methylthioribose kinase